MRELRSGPLAGLSRRRLIRRSLGAITGLWLLEVTGGTIAFLWPNLSRGFGSTVTLGDLDTVAASPESQGARLKDGAPSYFPTAKAFIQLVDANHEFEDGVEPMGEGTTTNVRTLYQRCPHLGCKPNFCTINYWFECPCHGSRYDRLGTKIQQLGPAPRGLDRFAHTVKGGVLTVDTSKITLGPLPIPLGQPGIIAPRSPTGCL
jgi:cytochrome b6-f complex iron-sulfur subunit